MSSHNDTRSDGKSDNKSNSNSDDDLFSQEMGDVKPLVGANKAAVGASSATDINLQQRRRAAIAETGKDSNFLTTEYTHALDAHDIIEYKRPGMQHGVHKKFRLGQYTIEATLDLHRMTVEQARREVFDFIHQCGKYGLRMVQITHGKGMRSADKVAVLKSCLAQWLPEFAQVLAVQSAQPHHGGTGAVYVMLKKADKDKLSNKERHAKGKR